MCVLEAPLDLPVPFESKPSQVPGFGMGVWTKEPLKQGTALPFNFFHTPHAKRALHVWEVCLYFFLFLYFFLENFKIIIKTLNTSINQK